MYEWWVYFLMGFIPAALPGFVLLGFSLWEDWKYNRYLKDYYRRTANGNTTHTR